jgi:hypothetical protein
MSDAYERFKASMNIGYEQWHDGVGYDLDALDEMTDSEKQDIEHLLIARKDSDWRDAEALARLGSARAVEALHESMKGPNREVRLRAAERLRDAGHSVDLEALIVEALGHGELGDGLGQAEMLAEEHPTEAVKRALLTGALCAGDGRGVRFSALLLYLHGLAPEAFDWNQRPFFLKFTGDPDRPERREAFAELCAKIGADPLGVTCA